MSSFEHNLQAMPQNILENKTKFIINRVVYLTQLIQKIKSLNLYNILAVTKIGPLSPSHRFLSNYVYIFCSSGGTLSIVIVIMTSE